jgi:hypothetical protein
MVHYGWKIDYMENSKVAAIYELCDIERRTVEAVREMTPAEAARLNRLLDRHAEPVRWRLRRDEDAE